MSWRQAPPGDQDKGEQIVRAVHSYPCVLSDLNHSYKVTPRIVKKICC